MRRISSGRGAIAALFALALTVTPAIGQQISAEAKEHFASGVTLLKDPDGARYQDAYIQFKLAYEKSGKSWKVLGNLALCSMKLERDGEAIEYYERYIREAGKELDGDEKKQVESDLRVLKSGVAKVTLKADVTTAVQLTDARVRQNGTNLNTYSLENGVLVLGVRAGHHTFTAKSGAKDVTWEVDLTPGQAQEHLFPFTEKAPPPPVASTAPAVTSAAPPPPPPPTTTAPPPPPPSSTMKTIGYVGAGVGGALIVGGVITGLMAKSKFNSVKDSCVTVGSQTLCPQSKQSDVDSAKSLATVTNVLIIGGALVAAGGVTLILIDPGSHAEAATRVVSPSVGLSPSPLPGGAGVVAHGSFLGVPAMALARSIVLSASFALAAVIGAGCSIDDGSLTFVPDNQLSQGVGGGSSGTGGVAGTGGTGATGGTATGGSSGAGTGGAAGSAGGASLCVSCANDKCPILATACSNSAKCLECLQNPNMPLCATQAEFVAVGSCLCKDCQSQCGLGPGKCGGGGAGGAGGTGGKGGTAGAGGSSGAAGAGGAGAGGTAGTGGAGGSGGSGPATYTTCDPCTAAKCKPELIACNGDAKCSPCINGNITAECATNTNYKALLTCKCTSDCGQLCACSSSFCGNGKIDGSEDCEGADLQGKTCSSVLGDPAAFGSLACSSSCHFDVSNCTSQTAYCGDKKVDGPTEACDAPDFGMATCASVLGNPMATGLLACTYTCGVDSSKCTVPAVCGDNIITAPGEQCDGSQLGGASCATVLGTGATGLLKCAGCKFDLSGCMAGQNCGNGAIDPGEQCDGANLNGGDCKKFLNNPLATGTLSCAANCTFVGSACSVPVAQCGNGVREAGEQCDKLDLGPADCKAATGNPNSVGTLKCTTACTFDTSACMMSTAVCGNSIIEPGEQCDATNLGNQSCQTFLGNPAATGQLLCDGQCHVNGSQCTIPVGGCGNSTINPPSELCDKFTFPPGIDCRAWRGDKQATGSLACNKACTTDGAGCASNATTCGNGILEGAEECDGANFGGIVPTCGDLIKDPSAFLPAGSALKCRADCTIDAAACTTPCGVQCSNNICDPMAFAVCDVTQNKCVQAPIPPLDDGLPCTFDYCDELLGHVRHIQRSDCCAHSLCSTGERVSVPGCSYGGPVVPTGEDQCMANICKLDPFCCQNNFDQVCVGHLKDPMYCPTTQYSCGCAHKVCEKGVALDPKCDPCVEAVCLAQPQCCSANGDWDATCIESIYTVCHFPPSYACNP
jgi:hypothetical protein